MKFLIVEPSSLPILIPLGPIYSSQDSVMKTCNFPNLHVIPKNSSAGDQNWHKLCNTNPKHGYSLSLTPLLSGAYKLCPIVREVSMNHILGGLARLGDPRCPEEFRGPV